MPQPIAQGIDIDQRNIVVFQPGAKVAKVSGIRANGCGRQTSHTREVRFKQVCRIIEPHDSMMRHSVAILTETSRCGACYSLREVTIVMTAPTTTTMAPARTKKGAGPSGTSMSALCTIAAIAETNSKIWLSVATIPARR